jgi:hypothetical protein
LLIWPGQTTVIKTSNHAMPETAVEADVSDATAETAAADNSQAESGAAAE